MRGGIEESPSRHRRLRSEPDASGDTGRRWSGSDERWSCSAAIHLPLGDLASGRTGPSLKSETAHTSATEDQQPQGQRPAGHTEVVHVMTITPSPGLPRHSETD